MDGILLFHEIVHSCTCNTFMEVVAQYKLVVQSNLHYKTDRQTDSPYIDSHFNLSKTATSLQWSLSSVPKVAVVSGEVQLYFFSCWALPFHLSLQKEHWTTAQKYCKTWRLLEEGSLTRPTTLANGSKSKKHKQKLLWHNHVSIKIMILNKTHLRNISNSLFRVLLSIPTHQD